VRVSGDAAQLIPRVHDSLERAVLGVRSTCLERHHERLTGGVHDAVADFEARAVHARQNFEAHADPCLRAGGAPARLCGGRGGKQGVRIGLGVANAKREAKRRNLGPDGFSGSGLVQFEGLIQVSLECRLTIGVRCFPVHFRTGHLDKWAPVAARLDGGERLLQRVFVLGK